MTDWRERARDGIAMEARRWLATPYRHQHMAIGHGVDCIGLIWAVGENTQLLHIDRDQAAPFLGYTRMPNPRRMRDALEMFWSEVKDVDDVLPGDFCWMGWDQRGELPQHLAILVEYRGRPHLVHASAQIGRCVEHGFVGEWPTRVHSWWRYPGLA